jgi:S-DNA-T family DNA segregation ATPase FtsK/SpoIIIE
MARSDNNSSGGRTKSKVSRKKKSTARSKEQVASFKRRRLEVLGLVLMTVSLLLALAIVSYTPSDDLLAKAFSFGSAFDPAMPPTTNIMGLLGAFIAWLAVPNFLGYPVVGFPLLLLAFGWSIFRGQSLRNYAGSAAAAAGGVILVSTFAGWLSLSNEPTVWSGELGAEIAQVLSRGIGSIGAIILIVVFALILSLVSFDRDLQDSIDWIGSKFSALQAWIGARIQGIRDSRAARKEVTAPVVQKTRKQPVGLATEFAGTTDVEDRLSEEHETINDQFKDGPIPASLGGSDNGEPEPDQDPAADLSLHVRERVEEEKVNLDERDAESHDPTLRYQFPSVELLDDDSESRPPIDLEELEENKQILLDKLQTYNIEITNIDAVVGPTVTLYELTPAPGVKISRIKSLEDDLAMAMAARGIRMIAPIPGKSAIGVEIPNRFRELVQVSSVLNTARFRDAKMSLPVAIGKTIEGEVYVEDLAKMPHLLIAGATGSGKSVGLNNLIANLLYACHPSDLKFVMIDPKRIELQQYARIFDHFIAMPEGSEDPITTDFTEAAGVLHSCLKEMELRYDLLSSAGVRTIKEYNIRFGEGRLDPEGEDEHKHLPYIVVVIDELADLMMTAGKQVEGPIARLAQMARAVGIHLVVATQRPSVNVITGLIKANFPSRIAFQVASGVDSRTITDQYGAEQLVGNGDLLYMLGSKIIRLQSPFISLDEIEAITTFIANQPGAGPYILPEIEKDSEDGIGGNIDESAFDPLFKDAARTIVRTQQGSVSLLQRKLSVGYARAARIVDQLEQAGVVGPFEGSKARQVLIADDLQLDQFFNDRDTESD